MCWNILFILFPLKAATTNMEFCSFPRKLQLTEQESLMPDASAKARIILLVILYDRSRFFFGFCGMKLTQVLFKISPNPPSLVPFPPALSRHFIANMQDGIISLKHKTRAATWFQIIDLQDKVSKITAPQ